MSDTDSFIEEVSEEVRRDRLFKIFKKYGWVAVVIVILLVGGAAFNEYRKISNQKRAAELGDKLYQIMELDLNARLSLLENLNPKHAEGKALVQLIEANTFAELGNIDNAIKVLEDVSDNPDYSSIYTETADFKSILLSDNDLTEKLEKLQTYSQPGSAFRNIALEETSLIQIKLDQISEAIITLTNLLQEPTINQGQAKRSSDLLRTLSESKGADAQD